MVDKSKMPPVPKWQPAIPVDIDRTAKTAAHHLGDKFSFAVLAHGTCVVLSPEELSKPQSASEAIMREVLYAHPDVKTRFKDDGNCLILYSHPAVASVVFGDVVDANWAYIEQNHLDGMVEGEVFRDSSGQTAQITRGIKIALFGRSCMFMDAIAPKVVKVWRAAQA